MDFQHFAPQINKLPRVTRKEIISITYWNSVRDNFNITTWLAMGAILQGLLVIFVRPTFAVAPAALVLSYRFSITLLTHLGIRHNTLMDESLMGKYSVQIPDKNGNPPTESAENGIAMIMLGMRSNHALGMFGSGAREVSNWFAKMAVDLHSGRDQDNGFLGVSYYRAAHERLTCNGVMSCLYFRSVEDIHRFAHGPIHREAWTWWNSITEAHPHLSIMHEVYNVQKKNWENIYINYHLTGIAKVMRPVFINGQEYRPIANADRGPLSTQKGRLGRPELIADEKQYLVDTKAPNWSAPALNEEELVALGCN